MAGSVTGALRPQKAAPTMPYSAQLAPTASAKRRFVELRFPVKKKLMWDIREKTSIVLAFLGMAAHVKSRARSRV